MLSIKAMTKKYSEGGIHKAKMPITKMFILAFMAGMFISFAGVASSMAIPIVESPFAGKVVASLIFPAGLAMVLINGAELFTGNNLMIMSVLDKRISILDMLKNWVVVYTGNFLGAIFVTGLYNLGHGYSLINNTVAKNIVNTAVNKCTLSPTDAFVKGVLCNILVCVAVIMTMNVKDSVEKIAVLFFPIMLFVVSGFEHSVANMSYISNGLFVNMKYGNLGIDTTMLTWYNFLVRHLLPVTLGNMAGGISIGVIYWFIGRNNKR